MEVLKFTTAIMLATVLLGGLYIGSALVGYFLAILGIIFIVVCIITMIGLAIYQLICYTFSSKKKRWKPPYP